MRLKKRGNEFLRRANAPMMEGTNSEQTFLLPFTCYFSEIDKYMVIHEPHYVSGGSNFHSTTIIGVHLTNQSHVGLKNLLLEMGVWLS